MSTTNRTAKLPADVARATERVEALLQAEAGREADVEISRSRDSLSTDRRAVGALGYARWRDVPEAVRQLLCACRALAFWRASQRDDGRRDPFSLLAEARREVWAIALAA